MTGITDAVVIGIVLTIVLAAVSYYLYSRTTQLEKKVGLIENILLDLKVTTEQAFMVDIPERGNAVGVVDAVDVHHHFSSNAADASNASNASNTVDEDEEFVPSDSLETREVQISQENTRTRNSPSPIVITRDDESTGQSAQSAQSAQSVNEEKTAVTINYEANTYRELVQIAKQKGVTGSTHMSKGELIAALRRKDSGMPVKEAPAAWQSFLDAAGSQVGQQSLQSQDGQQSLQSLQSLQSQENQNELLSAMDADNLQGMTAEPLDDGEIESFVQ